MLFRRNIERSCAYCRYGGHVDKDLIICSRKGFRAPDQSCWRFSYDPYKRIPKKSKAMDFAKYDSEDFSL